MKKSLISFLFSLMLFFSYPLDIYSQLYYKTTFFTLSGVYGLTNSFGDGALSSDYRDFNSMYSWGTNYGINLGIFFSSEVHKDRYTEQKSRDYNLVKGFELSIEHNSKDVLVNNETEDWGSFEQTPISLRGKIHTGRSSFLGTNLYIGLGVSINKFNKNSYLDSIEKSNGGEINIDVNSSFFFDVGLGFDFNIARNVSFFINANFLIAPKTNSEWKVYNIPTFAISELCFKSGGTQLLAGFNFWIPISKVRGKKSKS